MSLTIELNAAALIILIVVILVELFFHPRIDKTGDGKVILWYGRRNRYYIILKK